MLHIVSCENDGRVGYAMFEFHTQPPRSTKMHMTKITLFSLTVSLELLLLLQGSAVSVGMCKKKKSI